MTNNKQEYENLFETQSKSEEMGVYASSQGMFDSNNDQMQIGGYIMNEDTDENSASVEAFKKTKTIYCKSWNDYFNNKVVLEKIDEIAEYCDKKDLTCIGKSEAMKLSKKIFSPKVPHMTDEQIAKNKQLGINVVVSEKVVKNIPVIYTYCEVDNSKVGTTQVILKDNYGKYTVKMLTSDIIFR